METTLVLSEYEIERGKPMPSKLHASIQSNLVFEIMLRYRETYRLMSEISLELGDWKATPDIGIFPAMELDFLHDEILMTQLPLCSIEILSPSQSLQELIEKAEKYFECGIKSCWLVLPGLKNVYVFSTIFDYKIFTEKENLMDYQLNIEVPLSQIFI
jgi:Uma2 family endonuclease